MHVMFVGECDKTGSHLTSPKYSPLFSIMGTPSDFPVADTTYPPIGGPRVIDRLDKRGGDMRDAAE